MFCNSQGPIPAVGLAFPDVLLEPPFEIPVPFPNVSMSPMAIPTCPNVMLMCMPAHNMTAIRAVSIDGPGIGAMSGTDFGPHEDVMGSTNLFIGGPPATKMLMPTNQNLVNAHGFGISPSQVVLMAMR